MMDYTLVRSRRKTLAIHITPQATLEVRAPLRLSKGEIDRFVQEKQPWIARYLSAMAEQGRQRQAFAFCHGGTALYLGQAYPIAVGAQVGFDGQQFTMPGDFDGAQIQSALEGLYKALGRQVLPQRVAQYAQRMGVGVGRVGITSAKTRWGSCSSAGNVNFSWRLLLAAEDTIDYVVVHELAHRKQMNHSPLFWAEVAKIFPDYQIRRKNLAELQKTLILQGL